MTISDLTITERVQRAIRNKLNEAVDTHVADAHDGLTRVDGFINTEALATAAVDAIKQAVDDAETPQPQPVAETQATEAQATEPVPVTEPPKPEPIPPQPEDDDDDDDDDEPPAAEAPDPVADTKKKQNKKTRRRLKERPE